MKKHLNDGQLRAALDAELNPNELEHLKSCVYCQTRQKTIRTQTDQTAEKLAFLSSATKDSSHSFQTAWNRFNQQKITQKETPMFKKLFASPLIRYVLPGLLILTLILAMPGTRALASELLNLFRVQQVAVVTIDSTGMEQLNGVFGNQVGELISDSITMTREPGEPVDASDANQASQLTGFTVRLPQDLTPSRISVMGGSAFTLTVDRTKAQALLEEAGRSDLVLPDSIDDSTAKRVANPPQTGENLI